jgi:hypothetical protein
MRAPLRPSVVSRPSWLRRAVILGLACALVAGARAARANPFGFREHDGFYLRMSAGAASLQIRRATERSDGSVSVAYAGNGSRLGGASLFTELSVGGTPWHGFVLCGTLLGNGLPITELKVASGSRIDLGTPLVFAMLGPSIDVYPDRFRGFHAGGGVGLATSTAGVKDPIFSTIGGFGPGITLTFGYDFWIGDDWSLGLAARGVVAYISGQQESNTVVGRERDTASTGSIALTVLYH